MCEMRRNSNSAFENNLFSKNGRNVVFQLVNANATAAITKWMRLGTQDLAFLLKQTQRKQNELMFNLLIKVETSVFLYYWPKSTHVMVNESKIHQKLVQMQQIQTHQTNRLIRLCSSGGVAECSIRQRYNCNKNYTHICRMLNSNNVRVLPNIGGKESAVHSI